jgi:orotate phosphoribosyltransferase
VSGRESLAALLRERSVSHGEFVLSSGQRSTYYIDARKTTMSAEGQRLIGPLALAAIRKVGWLPAAVGGLTMGADPVAYAIARASADSPPLIEAFSVRKTTKEHGTRQRIEGNFAKGQPVVVVEDVITSGGSALEAIEVIKAEGGMILGVLALVDREQGGRAAIEASGFSVVVITTTSELLSENRELMADG